MVCITNTWHTTFYATDIARKRQWYEQRFRATEGLINYAVAVCKDNWQELNDPSPPSASSFAEATADRSNGWKPEEVENVDRLRPLLRGEPASKSTVRGLAELSTEQWPCGDGKQYVGQVSIAMNNKSEAKLYAQLLDRGSVLCAISCLVRGTKDEQGVIALVVDGWHIEA
jgi:hypothetical protein